MSIKIGIGTNLRITPSGVTPAPIWYEPEIVTYISGLATPLSDGQLVLLNNLVLSLKSGLGITALSDHFDLMYVLAGTTEESSLRNLVKNQYHASKQGTITFTALEGFAGNGIDGYLDSTLFASSAIKFVRNSASLGIYIRTNSASNTAHDIGYQQANGFILSRTAGGRMYSRINDGGGMDVANADSRGMYITNRNSSTTRQIYRNSIDLLGANNASTAISNYKFTIGACPTPVGGFSARQYAFAFAGQSLSAAQVISVTNAIETYMDANGKGVI